MGLLLDELYYKVSVETDELDKGVQKTEEAAEKIEKAMAAPVGAVKALQSSLITIGEKITDVMTGVTTDLGGIQEASAAAAKQIAVDYAKIEAEIAKGVVTGSGQDVNEWWDQQFSQVEEKAAISGPKLAKSLTEGIRMEFELAMADIREALARGLMTDEQAAAAGIAAGKAYNNGVISVIEQQNFTGAEGNALFIGLTKQLKTVDEVGKKAGVSITRLRGPLTSLATSAVGANRSVGQLVSTMALMGVSGGVVLAATAALIALTALYKLLKSRAEQAAAAVKALREEIEKKISGDPVNQLIDAVSKATVLQKEADRLATRAAAGRTGIEEARAKGLTVSIALTNRLAVIEGEAEKAQRIADRARTESLTQQNSLNADLARNLNTLVQAGEADANQTAVRTAFLANFRAELDNGNTSLERKVELIGIINDLTSADAKRGTAAAKTIDQGIEGLAGLKEKLAALTADITDSLVDDARAKVAELERELTEVFKNLAGNPALLAEAKRTGAALTQIIIDAAQEAETQRIQEAQNDVRDLISGMAREFGAVQETVAGSLSTAVDAVEANLIKTKNLTTENAKLISTWRVEIEKLRDIEPVLKDIDALIAGMRPSDNLEDLRTQLRYFNDLRSQTNALIAAAEAEGPVGGARAAELKTRLDALNEVIRQLQAAFAGVVSEQDDMVDKLGSMGQEIASIANGVIGLARAFGGLNAQASAVLQSVVSIGENIGGALAGNPASIFGALGGLAGLAAGLFGQSPEEKARIETSKKNTEALVLLTRKIGELNIGATGTQIGQIQGIVNKVIGDLRGNPDLLKIIGFNRIETAAKALGLTMADVRNLAANLGVTLDGSADSLLKFSQALAIADFARFAETFSGQRASAGLAERLGLSDPSAAGRFGVLLQQLQGSTTLFDGISAESINSAEGRDAILNVMRSLFARLMGEGEKITSDEIGNLLPQDIFAGLNEMIELFNDFTGTLGGNVIPTLGQALQKLGQRFLAFNVTDITERTTQILEAAANFSPALASALEGLDATTAEGRAGIIAAIQALFTGITEEGQEIAGVTSDDLLAILGSLFSLSASEEAELQRQADAAASKLTIIEQEARTRALAKIANVRDLAGLEDLDNGDVFGRLLTALGAIAPGVVEALGAIDASTEEGAALARGRLAQLFQEILSATDDIDGAGLEVITGLLAGSALTIEDIMSLLLQLGNVASGVTDPVIDVIGAVDRLALSMSLLNSEFTIFNIDNPIEQVRRLQETLSDLSPTIASAIAGLDLTTVAGREAARLALQDLFAQVKAGTLDESALGGISLGDILGVLTDIASGINRADAFAQAEADRLEAEARRAAEEANRVLKSASTSRSTRAFGPVASEGQAVLLLGYASAQVILLRQIASNTARMAGLRAPIIPGTSGRGGGVTINLQNIGNSQMVASFVDEINRSLGTQIGGQTMNDGTAVRVL